jgi:hypothetical protein
MDGFVSPQVISQSNHFYILHPRLGQITAVLYIRVRDNQRVNLCCTLEN